jgi:RHS repeat-associated protein
VQEKKGTQVKANLVTGLGLDEYLTRIEGNTTRHLLPDALGSTLALTDTGGTIKTEYTYEPFGKTTATGQTSTNTFKYTGREDDGTGLYYYRARYYHPGFQRFVSEDPINLREAIPTCMRTFGTTQLGLRDPLGLWTVGIRVQASGGLLGHGGSVGVSLVIDGRGNVGVRRCRRCRGRCERRCGCWGNRNQRRDDSQLGGPGCHSDDPSSPDRRRADRCGRLSVAVTWEALWGWREALG